MDQPGPTRAQQVARAVIAFERERAGRLPASVAVALTGDTLVVTLHGALSPAERALAQAPAGAALVHDFHRALFANACGPLCQEVAAALGAEVREAAAEVQGTTGTLVLLFVLGGSAPLETWSETIAPGG